MTLKKLSRRSFLALTGMATFGVLAASCAPAATPTPKPAEKAAPTVAKAAATAAPAAAAGITLRYLSYQGRWGKHEAEFVTRYANEHKPEIKEIIQEEASYADAAKKIQAYFVTGTLPEAGYVDHAFYPFLAAQKCFLAIDELAAAKNVDLTKRLDYGYYKRFSEGKSTAIGGPGGLTPAMIAYNVDMVKAKGVALPKDDWTIVEFEEWVVKMGDKGKKIFGCNYGIDGGHGTDGWFRTWGGQFLSDDGKKCLFAEPKMQDALKWQMRMMKDGYWPGRSDTTEGSAKMFVSGVLASYICNAGEAGSIAEGIGDRFKWDYVLLPKGPACDTKNPCRGYSPYTNAMWAGATTKYPEHAFGIQVAITSRDCAIWGVENLGRQPGSDISVWRDPKVTAKYPIWGKLADQLEKPAGEFPMPANFRYLEYMDVGTAEYGKLGFGDVPYNDANVQAAATKVQAILDLKKA